MSPTEEATCGPQRPRRNQQGDHLPGVSPQPVPRSSPTVQWRRRLKRAVDYDVPVTLPTNRGFIRSALSEGLSSNRHCELLEFAVTRRKQTTDTRSKSSLFSPTRNGSTPQIKSCRSRITNHKSRVTNLANSRYNQAFICASPQSNGCTEQAITEALKGKNA